MKSFAYTSLIYYLLRVLTFPLSLLPYRALHRLGKILGSLAYWFGPKEIRKITFNNLALAKDLKLSEAQIKKIAKESFQNLMINSVEYIRLKRSRYKIGQFVTGCNLTSLYELIAKGQGVICVTGHISNWELSFLDHTQTKPGIAIGKHIKNKKLYDFILSIRQMHQGKIIGMKNAINEAVKELKSGATFSMVNDQAYTSSSYSYPFFGVKAWTSAAPALIAYKANAPIFTVGTKRLPKGKYEYTLSEPIWPDTSKPLKQEVTRLMDAIMKAFEQDIAKNPGQWLWQHKRWKQEGYNYIRAEYKADSILIVLPDSPALFEWFNQGLWAFPQIYTRSFLTFMVPKKYSSQLKIEGYEVLTYESLQDILIRDYRFQLIYDFTNQPKIGTHFLKLGAHSLYTYSDLKQKNPSYQGPFADFLTAILCLELAKFNPPEPR